MEEIWKDVPGFDGLYEVSNIGFIKSIDRTVPFKKTGTKFIKGTHLVGIPDKDGYLRVNLYRKGKLSVRIVHRVVASVFVSNENNKHCVNHKNGIKTDNRAENLEFCTIQENNLHSRIVLGKHPKWKGTKGTCLSFTRPILQFTMDGIFIKEFHSIVSASLEINRSTSLIGNVCRGIDKSAGGFIWKYKTLLPRDFK